MAQRLARGVGGYLRLVLALLRDLRDLAVEVTGAVWWLTVEGAVSAAVAATDRASAATSPPPVEAA